MRRWAFRVVLFGLVVMAAALALRPVSSLDTPWHLMQARQVLAEGRPLFLDQSSFTKPDALFVDQNWLAQLGMHGVFSVAGFAGLSWAVALLAAVGGLLLFAWAGGARRAAAPTLWVVALAMAATSWRYLPRPQVLFVAGLPGVLWLSREWGRSVPGGRRRRGLALTAVAIQVLWAQVHGSFILFPFLMAAGLYLDVPLRGGLPPWRRSGWWLPVLLLLLTHTSPWSIDIWPYLATVGRGDATEHIREFRGLRWYELYPRHVNSVLWLDVLLVAAGAAVALVRRSGATWGELGLAVGGALLTFRAHRFRAAWAILLVPLAVRGFHLVPRRFWAWGTVAALLVLPATYMGERARNPGRDAGPGLARAGYPIDAARFLKSSGVRGRLFNMYDDGGWLANALSPEIQITIDGRTPTLFDAELYFWYRRARFDPVAFENFEAEFGPDLALVYRDLPLCGHLDRRPEWRAVYFDERRSLFAKHASARGVSVSTLPACAPLVAVATACRQDPAGAGPGVRAAIEMLRAPNADAPFAKRLWAEWQLGCSDDAEAHAEAVRVLTELAQTGASDTAGPRLLEHWAANGDHGAVLGWAPKLWRRQADDRVLARWAHALAGTGQWADALARFSLLAERRRDGMRPEDRLGYARALAVAGRVEQALDHGQRAAWSGHAPAVAWVRTQTAAWAQAGGSPSP